MTHADRDDYEISSLYFHLFSWLSPESYSSTSSIDSKGL